MHAEFDPQNVDWNSFIRVPEVDTSDSSKSIDILQTAQFGNGYSPGYAVFSGSPYQRGAGIGSLFRSFWRYLIPIGKNIAAAVGKQGLQSGTQVLNDVLEGKNLKNALADEGRSGLKNLLDKASNNLARQSGQNGSGSFDFKRYKKNAGNGENSNGKNDNMVGSVGLFTASPPLSKTINRKTVPARAISTNRKNSQRQKHKYSSTIDPSLLPIKPLVPNKKAKYRIDSLGQY